MSNLFFRVALTVLFATLVGAPSAFAVDVPQSFTLDGRLFSNPAGTTPLVDSSISLRVQILDEDKICILYEETQSISTLASQGYFSVQVGSEVGSLKRSLGDSGKTMSEVFSNLAPINGKAVLDGSPCAVPAVGGKRRFVRMIISPSTMGGQARTLQPDLTIDSVPNAVIAERAESIQGLRSSNLLQTNTSGTNVLTQNNLESLFSSTARYNAMTSLLNGNSAVYMRSNSTSGAQLPSLTGAPMSPTAGSIWFDSSDEKVKFQTAGGPVTLTTGTPGISALTGDVTATGTGSVAATVANVGGSTAANVNAATVLANASTDANTNSAIVRRDGSGGFAAGAVSVSSVRLKDATTNYVTLNAANAVTSYAITLPAAVGTTGQTLVTTNSTGTLAWVTPVSTSIAGTTDRIAKFTGGNTLADSLITDNGTKIIVGSALDVTGNLDVTGTIKIAGGSPALGRVLTSDAQGNGTWSVINDSAINYATQTQKTFFAAPNGATGVPTFRTIVLSDLPSGVASATGTTGKIPKFTGANAMGDSLISDDGNQVTVASNVVSTPTVLATGSTVDLRTSNTHVLQDVGGSTITLQNMAHGGLYNIVVADNAARTYTFAGCTTSYYKPAKGPTTLNTQTVFGVLFVSAGGGAYNCYITWSTGYTIAP